MKTLNNYITEKLHINNTTKIEYMYHPKDKNELVECIINKIKKEGVGTKEKPLDFNDIDTSKITDMSKLFDTIDGELRDLSKIGYFDISDWNMSNVKDMSHMFNGSKFNGDISDWDVSKVKDMTWMFAWSKFNGDISKWNVNKVENMYGMFYKSAFTGENGNLSNWDVSNVDDMKYMFTNCPLEKNPPKWYKTK